MSVRSNFSVVSVEQPLSELRNPVALICDSLLSGFDPEDSFLNFGKSMAHCGSFVADNDGKSTPETMTG